MGYKKVCLFCRKAFNVDINVSKDVNLTCPECGHGVLMINHNFRPPKKEDLKGWKVVELLTSKGFNYDHVWEKDESGSYSHVPYPTTLKDAEEFVDRYGKPNA